MGSTLFDALQQSVIRLGSTSTNTIVVLIILVLFGLILGLFAALLIYWLDRRWHCAWCHPGHSTSGGICLKHARQLHRLSARRRIARRTQSTTSHSLS